MKLHPLYHYVVSDNMQSADLVLSQVFTDSSAYFYQKEKLNFASYYLSQLCVLICRQVSYQAGIKGCTPFFYSEQGSSTSKSFSTIPAVLTDHGSPTTDVQGKISSSFTCESMRYPGLSWSSVCPQCFAVRVGQPFAG